MVVLMQELQREDLVVGCQKMDRATKNVPYPQNHRLRCTSTIMRNVQSRSLYLLSFTLKLSMKTDDSTIFMVHNLHGPLNRRASSRLETSPILCFLSHITDLTLFWSTTTNLFSMHLEQRDFDFHV